MPEALKNVPVLVRVLNSIRSAEMRLPLDTNTTLPVARHPIDVVEELGLVGEQLDVVAVDLHVLQQDGVRLVDVVERSGCRPPTCSRSRPSRACPARARRRAAAAANAIRKSRLVTTHRSGENQRRISRRSRSRTGPIEEDRSGDDDRIRPLPCALERRLDRILDRRGASGRRPPRSTASSAAAASRAASAPSCTRADARCGASARSISRDRLVAASRRRPASTPSGRR